MKKLSIFVISALFLCSSSLNSYARDKFFRIGLRAGLDFTNMSVDKEINDYLKTYNGFNTGLLLNFSLPRGFEIQPELLYVQEGANLKMNIPLVGDIKGNLRTGSIRVPVNIQWGISLFNVIKPYLMLSPYIGFLLFNDMKIMDEYMETNYTKFEYGIGAGIGTGIDVDVWEIQLSFKWNWTLNNLFSGDGKGEVGSGLPLKSSKYNGGELSLAFIF